MDCIACGSEVVTERPERTARGYRRFRCPSSSTNVAGFAEPALPAERYRLLRGVLPASLPAEPSGIERIDAAARFRDQPPNDRGMGGSVKARAIMYASGESL